MPLSEKELEELAYAGVDRPSSQLVSVRPGRGGAKWAIDFRWFPAPDDVVVIAREWQGNEYPVGRIHNTGALRIEVREARMFERLCGEGMRYALDCNGWSVPLPMREAVIAEVLKLASEGVI